MQPTDPPLVAALARIRAAAAQRDREGTGLDVDIGWLRELGLLAGAMPGISGWSDDPVAICGLLRAIGAASLPVGRLIEGHINAAQLLALYAPDAVRRSCAAAVRDGALLGVWGADGAEPLVAQASASGFVLSGAKCFCSGLGLVDFALVSARDDEGTRLFLIDVRDAARADHGQWDVSGMRATLSGGYDFTGLTIMAGSEIGPANVYFQEPHFLGGMYRLCAVQVGGLDAVLDQTTCALRHRGRGEDALAQYRLGQMASYRALAAQITQGGARRVADRCSPQEVAHEAILMREGVERCVVATLEIVERSLGTTAHRETCAVSRLRRDLSLYIRQAAVDERLMMAGRHYLDPGPE